MDTKYKPLTEYLRSVPLTIGELTLTFDDLEGILGFRLPKSMMDARQMAGTDRVHDIASDDRAVWLWWAVGDASRVTCRVSRENGPFKVRDWRLPGVPHGFALEEML